jgi:hypothetical protein
MWIIIGILTIRAFISRKDKDIEHKAILREYKPLRINILSWIKLN